MHGQSAHKVIGMSYLATYIPMKTEALFWDDLKITSCYLEVLKHMHLHMHAHTLTHFPINHLLHVSAYNYTVNN